MGVHDVVRTVGGMEVLDGVARRVGSVVDRVVARDVVKDALTGAWLGHRVHPLLTDIPIGSFTSATVLDLVGGTRSELGADLLVRLGTLSVVPTVLAGAADWSDTAGEDRRVGVVHAGANVVGAGLYAVSLHARRHGARRRATMLGIAGMAVMTVGGYLGGYLAYVRGVGVERTEEGRTEGGAGRTSP